MLSRVLEILATASLFVGAVQAYLIVNKIWSRKHERQVAEAQSITANLLGLVTGAPWIAKYALAGELKQAMASALWFSLTVFFTLVGLGFWVRTGQKQSLGSRLRAALHLERREVGELAKALFRPRDAALVLTILEQLALIDRELAPREREVIEAFARASGLPSPFAEAKAAERPVAEGYVALRASVAEYLASAPPAAEAAKLRELLSTMADADGKVSDEESIALGELTAMIDAYLHTGDATPRHEVVVVPQSDEQESAFQGLVRDAPRIAYRGGSAYRAGRFFSERYARMIRDRYRALGFFSIADSDAA